MITIEALCITVRGLRRADVERWIGEEWVRPDGGAGGYRFHDIDVARVRLIVALREQLRLDEEAVPVVLSLMDQLYEERRRLRRIGTVLGERLPAAMRDEVLALLELPS